jgi:hypothetical protein
LIRDIYATDLQGALRDQLPREVTPKAAS